MHMGSAGWRGSGLHVVSASWFRSFWMLPKSSFRHVFRIGGRSVSIICAVLVVSSSPCVSCDVHHL